MVLEAGTAPHVTPVFFLAGGTGITAEALGNAILQQFPTVRFDRRLFSFVNSVEAARRVVSTMDAAASDSVTPLVFSTLADDDVRAEVATTRCAVIDLVGSQLENVERVLHVNAARVGGSAHGLGDVGRYEARMAAVEFAMEHDDGQSLRALERADIILTAPSRCGKTPTTMYLALQHGLLVANYPLVDEDLESTQLPAPIRPYRNRLFGLLSTPGRLSEVRGQRRPGSRYASLQQCSYELRRAENMFKAHRIPSLNSATMSVEEMSAMIMQRLDLNTDGHLGRGVPAPLTPPTQPAPATQQAPATPPQTTQGSTP
ncbi:pyruvate, water dikinase regulatory protein [Nakamurella aerolata]|uniref:Putative phosphoenolpyruvate synthase regulatory protein n=1 Tax=Nakamurella aerolata TaxID=1656892 RepID=A0A849A6X6_9ACTN|nr:pyruvate, phosphate dikinase/phosphoenolpyruvate synthase regulator [Nakamurella aerolata]NNG35396.1 pyruvate, phosphate dikinase/phosphoenolpyruvate synthase regulator [Nakamurella aerolata]